ncbi:alkanesulfonate monooxygenase SsuD/methylene tetrahydromethanopterin reductase-like flavin-dependent oxidoreductase (luciferase family) [Actinokineospora baliensis]|uniref:LLM class flavin-dependent oxidoreductase n=1 Tax=Actinokineospora baliensis TaxID=547056 RepID=UPI00195E407F|nr:LLM class flavin-dependent oxidoreductase [Actinokineospora baliensis]MBM7772454.1 alkanesulfonate monooxygenase SsuD/methylene tetrahydromethanopterin reductase-like flavin-dependent oxidoreductase (luciferase family) [Actinokineospora baliensis]
MKLGVFLLAARFPGQTDTEALHRTLDVAVAAERVGLADAWVAEHHFMPYGTCPDAITLAAHLLGRTTRIDVGTAISVLTTAHPVALAERARLLNVVSDNRFRLGVGRGGPWMDLEVFGSSLERYQTGMPAALDLLLRALRESKVEGNADHPFRPVPMVPTPTAPTTLHLASTSLATVELAAAQGVPMLLGMHMTDDEKRAFVDHYRASGGPIGADHISTVVVHIADSREQAVAEVMATAPGWLEQGLAAHVRVDGGPGPSRDPVAYARHLCDLHPIGDPASCARQLRVSARRSGIDHLIALVEVTGSTGHALRTLGELGARQATPPGPDLGKLA